jgi:hypothetical protein
MGDLVGVRDSKDPDGTKLMVLPSAFRCLVEDVRQGRHDL